MGRKPKPRIERKEEAVTALVDPEMKKLLDEKARAEHVSAAHIVREALRKYLYAPQEKVA